MAKYSFGGGNVLRDELKRTEKEKRNGNCIINKYLC